MKHTKDDAADSVKQTIQKRTVLKKKVTEILVNGKNAVSVGTLNYIHKTIMKEKKPKETPTPQD